MKTSYVLRVLLASVIAPSLAGAAHAVLWGPGGTTAPLVGPQLTGPMANIVPATINGYLTEWCGKTLPLADRIAGPGLCILAGDETNNPAIAELVTAGLRLDRDGLGEEGFRLISHEQNDRRCLVITANAPRGLKHGCQELLFFHTSLTTDAATIDWPLDITMKPASAYRGVYMLPCWSAQDSAENWRRVLKFNSELTLNRVWFWLGGFPLLEKYGGEYKGTELADPKTVLDLIKLCRGEGMKFYIGDGWFTWHHAKAATDSLERGAQYYRDLLKLLPETEGIYLEPIGEGNSPDESVWKPRLEAMKSLIQSIWKDRPDFEFAIAIGKFNSPAYRKLVHEIDSKRIFWWWCWGDPIAQNALAEHPLVLWWHTSVFMSEYHGKPDAPGPGETSLTGVATSYDPGQGYGNPWTGWASMGAEKRRDFHPYTIPYFSHQYLFRERCWNPAMTEKEFTGRLARRLFDSDMPADAVDLYLQLASICPKPREADAAVIDRIEQFVHRHANAGTLRNRDTFKRMREALDGIRRERAKPETRPRP